MLINHQRILKRSVVSKLKNLLTSILPKKSKKTTETNQQSEDTQPIKKLMTIQEAMEYIQNKMYDTGEDDSEDDFRQKEIRQGIMRDAMSGDEAAYHKVKDMVCQILTEGKIEVIGFTIDDAVDYIYSRLWGLDVVEKYYRDKTVDEIRVNGPDNIYIVRRGKSQKVPETFESPQSIEQTIKRMIIEDVGVSLDRSSPRVESVRKDGSRLTATCYPVSKTWTFVLRKHDTFKMTLDNLIKAQTLDEKTWEALKILVRGRTNILFSGNVGAGKTSMMRKMVELMDPALRILVIGKDLELRLTDHYPDRDIIELEEHDHVGASMKALFETALRESPDCIIIEEFRGIGEAMEAIRACTRGHYGSMASAHFNNAEEAIEGTAMMMLEEGLSLPLELAKLRVARAFNVVVQMYGDSIAGIKKLISITEVYVDDNNKIHYIPLVEWVPSSDEYMGEGRWIFKNCPSKKLIAHMRRTISNNELEKVGWAEPSIEGREWQHFNCT